MSPTIVSKDGEPFMVIGSPGGSRIITITLEAIMNVVDHGMDLQEAIDAPRVHHQWLPDRVYIEPRGAVARHPADPRGAGLQRRHRPGLDDLGRGGGHPRRRQRPRRDRGGHRAALHRRHRQPGDGGIGEGLLSSARRGRLLRPPPLALAVAEPHRGAAVEIEAPGRLDEVAELRMAEGPGVELRRQAGEPLADARRARYQPSASSSSCSSAFSISSTASPRGRSAVLAGAGPEPSSARRSSR